MLNNIKKKIINKYIWLHFILFFQKLPCHCIGLALFVGANIPYDFPTIRNMELTWNFLAFESQSNLYNIILSLSRRTFGFPCYCALEPSPAASRALLRRRPSLPLCGSY